MEVANTPAYYATVRLEQHTLDTNEGKQLSKAAMDV
jgi:hypothetical protein